jgi:hypothetical protein
MNLPTFSTCSSKNIIYSIQCLKCKKSYIGQSSRTALTRLSEHIYKKKKYKKINNVIDTEKENEKNKDTHILYNHFKDFPLMV